MIPQRVIDLQLRRNHASARRWTHFTEHRARVTELALAAGGERIALLGAGNCNDVDLELLSRRFREIHLVDLDAWAVRKARARQRPHVARSIVVRAPIDLSGGLGRLAAFRRHRPTATDLAALPSAVVGAVLRALPESFDAVLSTCLLSQLMRGCAAAMGRLHPELPVVSSIFALAHARSIVLTIAPGGAGALVTDMASAETSAGAWIGRDLRAVARDLEATHRCAPGTGPAFLRRAFADDVVISPLLEGEPRAIAPWLWRVDDDLRYVVHALFFRCASDLTRG